ncbi:TraC family protein (plasmid) [Rhizobium sp. CB3090]|uniref:conjugal transfer protein TraC n=1 Tax=Rhizobium sp. CB3090 TaxID=3039156 RepID=UPI0024B03DCD|nr:conjugal transfer protein TraC [Rhizobium sp. CB3090]WFU12972.1 TraC family protein [Rhizobium sp. CB3090]
MKKPSSKIRDEIAKLQEQLKLAETREAERIGRIALKAGLGVIEIDEGELQAAFEYLAKRFRYGGARSTGDRKAGGARESSSPPAQNSSGEAESRTGEA